MPVIVSGPIFDGRAENALLMYGHDVGQHVADTGKSLVRAHLAAVIRHPTGRYEAGVHTDRQANDVAIHDADVVYGPWLEGVGSRNAPVTRFAGYHTFRIVGQELDRIAGRMANDFLQPYLREMN